MQKRHPVLLLLLAAHTAVALDLYVATGDAAADCVSCQWPEIQ